MELKKALVLILAHPDDESFAYSGLIQRAVAKMYTVQLHTLTQGEAALATSSIKTKREMTKVRDKEMKAVSELLKIDRYQYKLPDGQLILEEVKEAVGKIINKNNEAIISTTFYETTSHPDHKIIAKVIESMNIKNLLFHYRPDRWKVLCGKQYQINLTEEERKVKEEALHCHKSQKEDIDRYLQNFVPVEYFFSQKPTRLIDRLFESSL